MITIKQIQAFYWTARLGTVQKAALKLSVTPSAATKRIQELERLAIHPLFQHQGTGLTLTDHGRSLLAQANDTLTALASLEELRSEKSRIRRTLRIGITELSALTWFPAFAKSIRAAYPQLRLHPEVDLSAVLQGKILSGELDVVVIQDIYLPPELESIPIQTVQYGWFCKPGLLPTDRLVSLDEVAAYPVIEQNAGSGLTALTRRLFAGMGIDIEHVFGSNSLSALAGLVEAGIGVACLPVKYFRPAVRQGRMTVIRTTPAVPTATYHLAFRPDDQSALRTEIAAIARKCAASKPSTPSLNLRSRQEGP
ncbi:LysR family transcriptional regulator [Burkholderia sp. ISTR5]|uniref:LysR family transcriptional regulator n=1 Tax=Burkholderia sp. ISTR5 TaxID=2500161 RepID=UPI00136FB334|nr:LysR family transcriptional regulator [Burkholderia sp. ISTR5]NBI48851.1 LysR family transcriptional regulator [Burkholderia sp. ISTR5]